MEKEYKLGEFKFEVIYTPGHKEDSITFYFKEENMMFTGDFLFYDTIVLVVIWKIKKEN